MYTETRRCETPPKHYITLIEPSEAPSSNRFIKDVPSWVTVDWLCKRLKVTDRTMCNYRALAWDVCEAYVESVEARNPNWLKSWLDYDSKCKAIKHSANLLPVLMREMAIRRQIAKLKKPLPDQPPFNHIEATILIAIAEIHDCPAKFGLVRRREVIKKYLLNNQDFWRK